MLRNRLFLSLPLRSITISHGPLLQMRKNPTPEVHVAHEVHAVIQWTPPEKLKMWEPQKSCDLRPLPAINPNWLKLGFRPFANIVDSLPDHQRKLFTVALGKRKDAIDVIMENTLNKVRRHKYDSTSHEVIIAVFTIKIRNFQYLMQIPNDRTTRASSTQRTLLQCLILKRKKYMTQLKNKDYKRFEWLIQLLNILYKPNVIHAQRIKRRECFSTLTNMYCEDIIKKKMEAYKAELEEQKIPFLEDKLYTLNKIKEDEESMRIPCSVEEDIAETVKRLEALKNSCLDITPPPHQISA